MKTEIQESLDQNIPKDVIAHRSQGGKELSYLETWYVIDRMNQVFGQGNWGYSIQSLNKVYEGETEQYNGKAFTTSYIATVTVNAKVDGNVVGFTEVGYGDGADKKSPGKAHELATKEAVSDAVKRACKNLGRSMGLALYDKTQEFVGTSTTATVVEPGPKPVSPSRPGSEGDSHLNKGAEKSPRPVKELVTAAFKALEAQGKIDAKTFREKYLGGTGISKIPAAQLANVYETVCKDFGL